MYPYNNPSWYTQITAPGPNYTPWNMYEYYGFTKLDTSNPANYGAGQKIAIIDAYGSPTLSGDFSAFCTGMGLPSTTIQVYFPISTPNYATWNTTYNSSTNPTSATVQGWVKETSLDVQYAHAMALSATIMLVVSPDATTSNLLSCVRYAVNTLSADIVSMSFGGGEFPSQYSPGGSDQITFQNNNAIYVASSGDTGQALVYPGCSQYVLSVGGTVLSGGNSTYYGTAVGTYGETAWSSGGGNVSNINPIPSYQQNWSPYVNRSVPDVGYNAGNFVSVYVTNTFTNQGGWIGVTGTSAGAPQWAGIAAIRKANGLWSRGTRTFARDMYALASTSYSTMFNSISTGSNGFPATSGYDLITGLGTPKVNNLAITQ